MIETSGVEGLFLSYHLKIVRSLSNFGQFVAKARIKCPKFALHRTDFNVKSQNMSEVCITSDTFMQRNYLVDLRLFQ